MLTDKRCSLGYIGSKYSLTKFIDYVIQKEIKNNDCKTFGDLFAGTGSVGVYFKKKYKIIANDFQYYSYIINQKYIGINQDLDFKNLSDIIKFNNKESRQISVLNYLNNLINKNSGFIYYNYALGGTKGKTFERMYFSDNNAIKIDTIAEKIIEWQDAKKITPQEYFFLMATLVEAADRVANTTSVYGAFLKKLKSRAQKELVLLPSEIIKSNFKNEVYNSEIMSLVKNKNFDIVYLDPPYNSRQYATNYHLLETIAKYDSPNISGKTGLRPYDSQKSLFCMKNKVLDEFRKLILSLDCKYILVSYNNEGLMSLKDIQQVLALRGIPKTYILKYKRYKADKTENRDHKQNYTFEYIHFVCCNNKKGDPETIELDKTALN